MRFDLNKKENIDLLYNHALNAYKNSYSPYSNFKVGACVLTDDGKFIYGTNIENASFGLTNCAERSALFNTYSLGYKKENILCLAIVGNSKNNEVISPCGACRQVISELMDKLTPIVLFNIDKTYKITNISELLPLSFSNEDME